MIVIDTNVIAYLFIPGPYSENAELLQQQEPDWVAPYLWRSEFRNILATYLRKKIINYSVALQIIDEAEQLMDGNEYKTSSEAVLSLAHHSKCSAYDCEFVCLAQELNIPLVTADKKILTEFPAYCVSLTEFSS